MSSSFPSQQPSTQTDSRYSAPLLSHTSSPQRASFRHDPLMDNREPVMSEEQGRQHSGREADTRNISFDSSTRPNRSTLYSNYHSTRRSIFGATDPLPAVPQWQPDETVTKCSVCEQEFSLFFRKHHCRKCGRVVCGDCSRHRITLPRRYIVQPPWVDLHIMDDRSAESVSEHQSSSTRSANILSGQSVQPLCT